jgi:hypothetical protein
MLVSTSRRSTGLSVLLSHHAPAPLPVAQGMQMPSHASTPAGQNGQVGKHALGTMFYHHDGTETKATEIVSIKIDQILTHHYLGSGGP